jgi:enamine deaminase RidA (YjgF/YER057c/UK114 family)
LALRAAGASITDIVRVRYIVPERKEFPLCWKVLRKWLEDVKPAATMVQAGLLEEAMRIEIEVTARMGGGEASEGKGLEEVLGAEMG